MVLLSMFEPDDTEIAKLRFHILDSMMDDAEDVEQIYLSTNRDGLLKEPLQPRFALREIIDEMKLMLQEGYIRAHISNDEKQAPLDDINLMLFHHYWFSPTNTGEEAWQLWVSTNGN
jgi:hypothetical protein